MSTFREAEVAFGQAADSLRRARASDQDDESEIALGLVLVMEGFFAGWFGRPEPTAQLVREGLALLCRHSDRREFALGNVIAVTCRVPKDDLERQQLLEEGLACSRATGSYWGMLYALQQLGLYQETLRLCQEAGDRRGMAFALVGLGNRAQAGQAYAEAREVYRQSLALLKEIDAQWAIGRVQHELGNCVLALGEIGEAKDHYRDALVSYAEAGVDWSTYGGVCWGTIHVLGLLGTVALSTGDIPRARQRCREALEAVAGRTSPEPKLHVLAGCAALQAQEEDIERATEWLALVLSHPATVEETRDRAQKQLDELRGELDPAALEGAQARGRARNLETTMAELCTQFGLPFIAGTDDT